MHNEPQRDEVEMMDDGTDPGLLPPVPSGWSDSLTGIDGPRLWDRIISTEGARADRYERHATVVLLEVTGLDVLARKGGVDVAQRLFVQLARTLAVEIRSSDHIARVDRTRFAILLTETDEVEAINFVERVRAVCEYQIRAPELVRIGIGWASQSTTSGLRAAADTAAARLLEELRTAP